MNEKQQREAELLTRVAAGALDVGTAAELLGVSPRQVRRLRARFGQEGMAAVIHGNAGRAPANRTDPALLGDWLAARQAHRRATAAQPRRLTTWLPTRGNVLFTLVMIALLVAAQTAGALPLGEHRGVAPTATSTGTIAYQGRLADAAGAPLTGAYNMIFRLYAANSGGTSLWEEQWTGPNGVKVSDGLFNVMLGSLTSIPQAVITGHDQLFLGITVGTDDEMAPRVQLGSVPFAVQALTVPDGSVTTAKIADGAVTQAKLGADVSLVPPDGSITTAKIADGAVTSRKAGLVSKFAGESALGSTTSTTYVYFANRVRVTADLEVQQCVLVMYSVVAGTSSEGPGDTRALTRIYVDGEEGPDLAIGSAGTLWANAPSTIAKVIQMQLPAGSHEIELRFRAGNSGNTATFERATLFVTALSTSCGG